MVIDSHQHFWKYSKRDHAWIDDSMAVLRRDYLPEELELIFRELAIDGCVAVQAAQTEEETDFLLELAIQHPFLLGVVGWVDLRAEDLEKRLARWADQPRLRGFRHVVQDEPDPAFLHQPSFRRGLATIARHGYTYDLLIRAEQLPASIAWMRQLPEDFPVVLDHVAKPPIAAREITTWATYLRTLAQFPQVHCKLSGLVTEASWQNWQAQDLLPYLDVALEAFGPARLMYGSDWPVCTLAGTYQQVATMTKDFLTTLSSEEQSLIWGETARRFYGL